MDTAAREAFYRSEVQAVAGPYLAIGAVVLLFALAAALVAFPKGAVDEPAAPAGGARFADLLHRPRLIGATVAQFFYVGAQVGLWSYTIRYAQANAGMGEKAGADALFLSLVLFAGGRFAGTLLMARLAPVRLLALFAAVSLALVAGIAGGTVGLYALVATSFFMSIQFPTIFALGVEGLGPLRRLGSSLVVMAIIGGAALTAVMGLVSDLTSITHAMLVPAASFVAVLAFAVSASRRPAHG